MQSLTPRRRILNVGPGAGRPYRMGGISALYLADGVESADSYSISEFWMEAGQVGSAPHSHEANDDMFYVLDGVLTFVVDGQTIEAPKGTFLRVPAGVVHSVENKSNARAGLLNIFIPGGYEQEMPGLVARYIEQNPTDSRFDTGGGVQGADLDHLSRPLDHHVD